MRENLGFYINYGYYIINFDDISRYGNHLYVYGGGYYEIIHDEGALLRYLTDHQIYGYDHIVGPD